MLAQMLIRAAVITASQDRSCPMDTKTILPLVSQAIEDEIYDFGRQRDYYQIDENSGGNRTPANISMYVKKSLTKGCVGTVVYKNMPVGEVYRYFTFKNNMVVLAGDPESKFAPTGGSELTVYMKSKTVAHFVLFDSYEYKFTVIPNPTKERLSSASRRQTARIGYSKRESQSYGGRTFQSLGGSGFKANYADIQRPPRL